MMSWLSIKRIPLRGFAEIRIGTTASSTFAEHNLGKHKKTVSRLANGSAYIFQIRLDRLHTLRATAAAFALCILLKRRNTFFTIFQEA